MYVAFYSGSWACGIQVIAANNLDEATAIAKQEDVIPSCCGFDQTAVLPRVTATGKPRVLTGHSYAE